MKKNKLLQSIKVIILGLVLSLGISFVFSAVSNPMPNPINVGASPQIKDGGLSVNTFLAAGYSHFMQLFEMGTLEMDILARTILPGEPEKTPICADDNGYIILCAATSCPPGETLIDGICTPLVVPLSVTTAPVTNITSTTATGGGTLISNSSGATVSKVGIIWSTTTGPNLSNVDPNHQSSQGGVPVGDGWTRQLTLLSPNTTYYVRAFAVKGIGSSAEVAYGNEVSFTTLAPAITIPTVRTLLMFNIASTTAVSGGNVTSDGGASVIARGVVWSTNTIN